VGGGRACLVGLGISLVVAATGAIYVEALHDLHINSVGTLATWVAALFLVVTVLVALARKGRHAGWFHPLSLPSRRSAPCPLGAALFLHFTHEAVGLLYDACHAGRSIHAGGSAGDRCLRGTHSRGAGYIVRVGAAFART
jgi:hypothetical protein